MFSAWHADEDRLVTRGNDLAALLQEGKERNASGSPPAHLDSLVSLTSWPDSADSATLRATVGGTTAAYPRSVVVAPTYAGSLDPQLWERVLPQVLEVLVDVWSPQWGIAGSVAARDAQRDVLGVPGANLLTWLPGDAPGELPDGAAVRPLAGGALVDVRGAGGSEEQRVVALAHALARAGRRLAVPQPRT